MRARGERIIRVEGDVAFISLTHGREAVIDARDVPLVENHTWRLLGPNHRPYAFTSLTDGSGKRRNVPLHKMLTGFALTDHIDGDGLNNRRSNLREATQAQNVKNSRRSSRNTTGFKGVSWHARDMAFQANIQSDGKHHFLGYFETAEDAYDAYCKASAELHGRFGRTA